MEHWRTALYPLGFLSAFAFGTRFIIQWFQSEKAGASVVSRLFWQLSLLGNGLLMLHGLIQVQYPICLAQACNALISWRNLNLMQTQRPPLSTRTVCLFFLGSIACISIAFAAQDWLFMQERDWLRIPRAPWQTSSTTSLPLFWHVLGALSYLLFSSRFWVQWWLAERTHTSQLTVAFWWVSLIGALLSVAYFSRIGDSVNLIGPLLGIVPYVRNLILIRKMQRLGQTP